VRNVMMNSTPKMRAFLWSSAISPPWQAVAAHRRDAAILNRRFGDPEAEPCSLDGRSGGAAVADLWSELLRAQQRRIEMCRL